ncbi:MAG: Gldg family protein [Proteobacteria bacterium]|nr:Gldg family protein [Pseudomonadota bacterium]
MNITILKKYLGLAIIAIVLFAAFIMLEKNNYAYKLTSKNDLNPASIAIIQGLVGNNAMKFAVYSNKDTLIAKKIAKFLQSFRMLNKEIKIDFIDPIKYPSQAQQNAVSMQGEIVLSYQDDQRLNKINITELSETSIINAILRLQNDNDQWLLFAQGYGMKTIADDTATGLSKLLINLQKIGFNIARRPLNISLVLPESVKVIVLPQPTQQLDEAMVAWLQKQVEQGISIWWLDDVGSVAQPYLELAFDTLMGTKKKLDGAEYSTIIANFPSHKIVENFNQPIYLAEAREVISNDAQVFIQTSNNEPLAISKEFKQSRVVITGDADFISNQYINAAANKSLTIRIVDWLFYHDDRINIPVQVNTHTQLLLSKTQLITLSVFFLIALPLLFVVIAIKQWRRKRG